MASTLSKDFAAVPTTNGAPQQQQQRPVDEQDVKNVVHQAMAKDISKGAAVHVRLPWRKNGECGYFDADVTFVWLRYAYRSSTRMLHPKRRLPLLERQRLSSLLSKVLLDVVRQKEAEVRNTCLRASSSSAVALDASTANAPKPTVSIADVDKASRAEGEMGGEVGKLV